MHVAHHGLISALRAFVVCACVLGAGAGTHAQTTDPSATASLAFLRERQDEFHTRFPVYDDVSSAGNHFVTFGKIA